MLQVANKVVIVVVVCGDLCLLLALGSVPLELLIDPCVPAEREAL